MMNDFLGVCLYLASMAEPVPSAHRVDTCQEVARLAMEYKIDAYVAVALAYHESRFDRKVISSHGAVGPMQVKRKFIDCQHCSDIEAGMIALRYWMDRSTGICLALGRYAMGNKGVCGRRSKMIIALARELECRHGSDKDFCYEC